MQRIPKLAFWRCIELRDTLNTNYSPRVFEDRRAIAVRVMANCARMEAAGYLDPERLPL